MRNCNFWNVLKMSFALTSRTQLEHNSQDSDNLFSCQFNQKINSYKSWNTSVLRDVYIIVRVKNASSFHHSNKQQIASRGSGTPASCISVLRVSSELVNCISTFVHWTRLALGSRGSCVIITASHSISTDKHCSVSLIITNKLRSSDISYHDSNIINMALMKRP